jgi:hypothetical protein
MNILHQYGLPQRLQSFAMNEYHVKSPTRITFTPQMMIRPYRIIVRSVATPPPWKDTVLRLFGRLSIPWIAKRWDDIKEREVWRLTLLQPVRRWHMKADRLAQFKALANVELVSVHVGNDNMIVFPIHVHALSELSIAMKWDMPTVQPNQSIVLEFEGDGGPFHVMLIGHAYERDS